MQNFINYLENTYFFKNSLLDYGQALLIFLISILVLKIFQTIILKHLKKLALKTKTDFDDVLIEIFANVKPPFYILISIYFALDPLFLHPLIKQIIKILFIVTLTVEVVQAIIKLVIYFLDKYIKIREKKSKRTINIALLNTLKFFIKLTLWSIALLMILDNLGVNVTSIIASLGIGGIAVALAVQNILSDIFSSFSIYFDRPFDIGDYIQVGKDLGTVKYIGLKSTRLETLQGEELIISNKELTNARVQNYKRMQKRRVAFNLGLVYSTPVEKLEKIPEMIEKIVTNAGAEFSRCYLTQLADSSINFEIVYFVDNPDYEEYLKINQNINLNILKELAKEKIEIAYPSQSIYLVK